MIGAYVICPCANILYTIEACCNMVQFFSTHAPIAQGIERRSPEPGAQVRILLGAPIAAYRTKSVCENPYDTSKYLVL